MTSWLDEVVKAYSEAESPTRYLYWSGISVISIILKKTVWVEKYYYKLYPNTYTVLLSAESGLRKGAPLSFAKSVIEEASNLVGYTPPKIVSGMNTIQAIVQRFSQQITLENGKVQNEAQGALISDEFHNLLIKDPDALTALTGLYNTHEHEKQWEKSLKSGVEVLKSPCISLLVGSNERLWNDVVGGKDVEGGFIARSFIIYEKDQSCYNPLTRPPKIVPNIPLLAEYLYPLTKLKGEFDVKEGAKVLFEKWYVDICDLRKKAKDRTGSLARIHDQVYKAAMCIALSYRPELIINKDIMQEAIDKTEECIGGIKRVSMGEGKSKLSSAVAIVFKELSTCPDYRMRRDSLMNKNKFDLDNMTLEEVYKTIGPNGSNAIRLVKTEGRLCYELTENAIRQLKTFEEEE